MIYLLHRTCWHEYETKTNHIPSTYHSTHGFKGVQTHSMSNIEMLDRWCELLESSKICDQWPYFWSEWCEEMHARKRRECGLDEQRWQNSSIYSWSEEEGTTHYTMPRMLMIRMAQRSRGMGTMNVTAVHPTPTPPLVQNWHNCPLCTTLPAPWPRPWTLIVNNCLSVRDTADSHCSTNRKFH